MDGVELATSLRGRQVPLLLAYLVLHRERAVGREELIGMLWPQRPPRAEDAAMRTLLSRLRAVLGRDVLNGRDELALALPEPAWIDVEAAAAEVASARTALDSGDARGAWGLAQVPLNIAARGLLPGARAAWLDHHRRELADVRVQALEVIGRAGLRLGRTELGSSERAARTLIELEPYRESGYVLLMDALAAQGNVAEGVRVFEVLRSLLRDELGTVPSHEAIAANERLLHPPAPVPVARAPLPAAQLELAPELVSAASAKLIGRRKEMAELERWWRDAPQPLRPRVMLLSGDPGVGKSRLLAEIAVRAHEAGAIVLAGRAPEETLVPYGPFLEALGHYVHLAPLEELRQVARDHGPELSRMLVALRHRLPDLPAPDPGDPETDRYRLFEAVAGLLGRLSQSAPVLIVLDDLQWADRPTLLLVRHLARSPQAARVSIAGAYRAVERWSDGFEATLAALRHDRSVVALEVRGLSERDASELVGLRAGGTPSAELIRALHEETEGNPFFIEEIVRHLADAGVRVQDAGPVDLEAVGLPQDIRDVITGRLARLPPASLEWLRVAAVIGRDFDSRLVERVLGGSEDEALRALEAALDAGLVREHAGDIGRYGFSHALIRETLYESTSGPRRGRLHRRVGVAVEELGEPERHIGALALHFTRAAEPQDAERAIRYALQAGARATAMLANEEAAEHYARALDVLERTDPDAVARRCDLLLALGEARVRSGERPRAWGTFKEAAALAAQLQDGDRLARAAIGASRRYLQPPGVVDEELIGLLERALELAGDEPSMTRVQLLNRLCGALYFSPVRDRLPQLSAEASAIAAALQSPQATALAAGARRRARWGPENLDERLADSTALLRGAREAQDLELTLEAHAWLVVDLLERGDRRGVQAQVEAFTAGAEQLRQPLYLWNAEVWRAMLALLDGQLDRAEELATAATSSGIRAEGVTAPQYYALQLLAIRREQDRIGELEGAAREMVAANPARAAYRAGLATILQRQGREDEARAELAVLAQGGFAGIPRDGDWLVGTALAAEVAAGVRDAERATQLYELLAPFANSHLVIGLGAVCLGSVQGRLGRLALTTGRRKEAIAHLRAALAANEALGAAAELAHAQLDLAAALGAGPEARRLMAQAAESAERLVLPAVARRVAETGRD
ncbi:MAG: ATP-binding protein [Solirubrobacteraceae bacterium]